MSEESYSQFGRSWGPATKIQASTARLGACTLPTGGECSPAYPERSKRCGQSLLLQRWRASEGLWAPVHEGGVSCPSRASRMRGLAGDLQPAARCRAALYTQGTGPPVRMRKRSDRAQCARWYRRLAHSPAYPGDRLSPRAVRCSGRRDFGCSERVRLCGVGISERDQKGIS